MKHLSTILFLLLLTPIPALCQWNLSAGLMLHGNDAVATSTNNGIQYSPGIEIGAQRELIRFGRAEDLAVVVDLNAGYWNDLAQAEDPLPCSDCQRYSASAIEWGGSMGIQNQITNRVAASVTVGSTYSHRIFHYLDGRDLTGAVGEDYSEGLVWGTANVALAFTPESGRVAWYAAYEFGVPLFEEADYPIGKELQIGVRLPM
ncbi:MAG: hypothetical protein ACQETE_05455 [Bacteroidota bacterium]